MFSHTRVGVPYEHTHMGRPIPAYAYGPIYTHMGQNTCCYKKSNKIVIWVQVTLRRHYLSSLRVARPYNPTAEAYIRNIHKHLRARHIGLATPDLACILINCCFILH